MNYEKIYNRIIENRQTNPIPKNEYGENHHIIPRSLGGNEDVSNLVRLTAKEHFICHALLAEMYPKYSNEWFKMNHAFMMMKANSSNNRYINARLYELKRKDFSRSMSFAQDGNKNSQFGKIWIYSITERKSLKIDPEFLNNYIDIGFKIGRVLDFDKKAKDLIPKIKKIKEPKVKMVRQKVEINYENDIYNLQIINQFKKIFKIDIQTSEDINQIKLLLIDLYVNKKQSLIDISRKFNTNHVCILNYMKRFNIDRRNISESIINYHAGSADVGESHLTVNQIS